MSREYGEEFPTDVYDAACKERCRLGPDGCTRAGRCRLESSDERRSRCFSAHYDNRRGVLAAMKPENELTAVVSTNASRGLPQMPDPVAITADKMCDPLDDGCPIWGVFAECHQVEGPHGLTLIALRARNDNYAKRRKA